VVQPAYICFLIDLEPESSRALFFDFTDQKCFEELQDASDPTKGLCTFIFFVWPPVSGDSPSPLHCFWRLLGFKNAAVLLVLSTPRNLESLSLSSLNTLFDTHLVPVGDPYPLFSAGFA